MRNNEKDDKNKIIVNRIIYKKINNENYSYFTFHSGFDSSDSKKLLTEFSGPKYVVPITFPVTVSQIVMLITLKNPPSRSSTPPTFTVITYLTIINSISFKYLNIVVNCKLCLWIIT